MRAGARNGPPGAYNLCTMMRLILWFAVVLVCRQFLAAIPVLGVPFRIPFVGFFLTLYLVGWLGRRAVERWDAGRRARALAKSLGNVETPHNQGKLGVLYESRGRYGKAIGHLQQAVEGEPEVTEWHYRLGRSYLGAGLLDEALETLNHARSQDEEHAYGGVLMSLAEAQRRASHPDRALESIERFERNHGPKPESAYRRGKALAALGRKEESQSAYREISKLAGEAVRYQRSEARSWVFRGWLARVLG